MAKVVRLHWQTGLDSGLPRRDRRSCDYEAYVPDPLMGRSFTLEGPVAADVADAESAVVRLNESVLALQDTEALARLLLRAESVASSRIEGLIVGGRRLLRAEVAQATGASHRDVTAEEVLGNIEAMTWAVNTLSSADRITTAELLEVHRRLLANTHLDSHGGRIRTEQNWIGGSGYNPCSASFVPPPPELVPDLLDDLCAFCETDDLPTIVQAAVAHAQFETIHPFVDGNGRTGRALIHVILRRRGLAPRALPPVSLALATRAEEYVAALTATRYSGSMESPEATRGINRWIEVFAAACQRAVGDASDFEANVRAIQAGWRQTLGSVRAGSAVDLLVAALPGAPILTVKSAAELIGRSTQAVNEATARLEAAGVIRQITTGDRNRAFEASAVLDAFTDLERQLASSTGDTRSAPPARPTPSRRR